jgi:hypothetical protein
VSHRYCIEARSFVKNLVSFPLEVKQHPVLIWITFTGFLYFGDRNFFLVLFLLHIANIAVLRIRFRNPVPIYPLDPGSGSRKIFFWILDLDPQIPTTSQNSIYRRSVKTKNLKNVEKEEI